MAEPSSGPGWPRPFRADDARAGERVHPRALRARRRGPSATRSRPAPRAAARSTPRWPSSTSGAEGALARVAPPLLAAAGPRAPAVRGRAAPGRRHLLSAHQVDALSGTLTALLAEAQRNGNGNGNGAAAPTSRRARARRASRARRSCRGGRAARSRRTGDEDPRRLVGPRRGRSPRRRGPQRRQALLVRARHRRRQDRRRARLRRGLAHRRHPDPHPPPQPRRPVPRRAARPRLREPHRAGAARRARTRATARSPSRPTSGSSATRARSPTPTRSSSATRPTPRWARRPRPRSATGPGPVFIGMTATGALIARHVTDLFPTQTSRFDLAQAARRGVIAPLRCVRIPPGPGVRTIAKVPLRRGEVDTEFDQEMLAELLDQLPFNLAIADLYKTRFNGVPGVVYAAGVRHAYNVAQAFRDVGLKAQAVSGETPKRELARILAAYERGDIDVLVNAQLLAEGWNSPRATVCMHLAPTASKRIYQQRVGRVTRRHPGKEAGIVVDFVHPATKHDDPVVTLHSLLDRDVYRGGAIVVGPVRRGRGRRAARRAPRAAGDRRRGPADRGLRARAVADRRRAPRLRRAGPVGRAGRRARGADRLAPRAGDAALRPQRRAQARASCSPRSSATGTRSCACARCRRSPRRATPRRSTTRSTIVGGWPRDERREGVKVMLQALAEKRIGRRDQANTWIWRVRRVHARGARGVRRAALAGDQAAARAARQLLRRRPRAQRAAARARGAPAGPPAGRGAARRRAAAHARGRGGPARRAHAHGAQAGRAGARAAAQLPEGQGPPRAAAAQEGQGRGESQAPVEAVAAVGVEDGSEQTSKPSRRRRGAKRDADPDREVVVPRPRAARVRTTPKPKPHARKRAPKAARRGRSAAAAPRGRQRAAEAAEAQARGRKRAPKAAAAALAATTAPPKPKPPPRSAAPKRSRRRRPRRQARCRSRRRRRRAAKPKAGAENGVPTAIERAARERPRGRPGRLGDEPPDRRHECPSRPPMRPLGPTPSAAPQVRPRRRESTRSPASVVTRSAAVASIPAPTPSPPSQRTLRPSSASRLAERRATPPLGSASQRSSAASSSASAASTSSRPSVRGVRAGRGARPRR